MNHGDSVGARNIEKIVPTEQPFWITVWAESDCKEDMGKPFRLHYVAMQRVLKDFPVQLALYNLLYSIEVSRYSWSRKHEMFTKAGEG